MTTGIRTAAIFALLASGALAAPVAGPLSVTARIAGPDGGWDYASVDPARHRLLVSRGDGVMAVDLRSGAVTPTIVPGARVHASFVIPGTDIGVSTNGSANTTTLFDAATGKVTATIPTGANPDAAVYDPASRALWVMNGKDGTITVIDPVKRAARGSVAVGGKLEFAAVDGRGHLFVNVEDRAELAMVDTAGMRVQRRTALTGCEEPSGLALTRAGTLIVACANGVAKTADAATGRLLGDIRTGPGPDAVIYDARRSRAYIPAGGDGTLTIIDTAVRQPRRIGSVPTQTSARTGAVDEATGRIYLPAARFGPAVAGARPKAVPGSFRILVLSGR